MPNIAITVSKGICHSLCFEKRRMEAQGGEKETNDWIDRGGNHECITVIRSRSGGDGVGVGGGAGDVRGHGKKRGRRRVSDDTIDD